MSHKFFLDQLSACLNCFKEQSKSTLSRGKGTALGKVYSIFLQLIGISFQYYAVDVIDLLSLISSAYLPAIFLFHPSSTCFFCFLGLLYRKTLIECLLMLWPLYLHPAFSAALTPSTHYKVCRTSVRLPRKASHHHLCKTPGTSESV